MVNLLAGIDVIYFKFCGGAAPAATLIRKKLSAIIGSPTSLVLTLNRRILIRHARMLSTTYDTVPARGFEPRASALSGRRSDQLS